MAVLKNHENDPKEGEDNGLDFWNNDIGMRIGAHVAANGGDWMDVVSLCRELMVKSFAGVPYGAIATEWLPHEADDGIRRAYQMQYGPPGDGAGNSSLPYAPSFEEFASGYDRSESFLTSNAGAIMLDGGRLEVSPIATADPEDWDRNPRVDGQRIASEDSAYPTDEWATRTGFVYEPDNMAVEYYRSRYDDEPPVGFGGRAGPEASQLELRRKARHPASGDSAGRKVDVGRTDNETRRLEQKGIMLSEYVASQDESRQPSLGQALLGTEMSEADTLLTVPGHAMSANQREALMRLPAFSDDSDPLFGPAVSKYRDGNARAAERAVASGAVDIFGRPTRPVFAESDGEPADAGGRPMTEALTDVGKRLDAAAGTVGATAAAKALQGAVNDVGDGQVRAQTRKAGKMANRLVPRLVTDGVVGLRTGQAVRLALHHGDGAQLDDAFVRRLQATGRSSKENKTRIFG